MTPSLVGSWGALNATGGNIANTPAWGTGATRTAGDLGICVCGGTRSTGLPVVPTTPSGWNLAVSLADASGNHDAGAIFWRALTGSDAAPTLAAASGMSWKASLAEFSGTTGTVDQSGSATGTTSAAATGGAVDTAAGELLIGCLVAHYSGSVTITPTITLNNGTWNVGANDNATSASAHVNQGYSVTTSNSSADSLTYSPGTTPQTTLSMFATFLLPAVAHHSLIVPNRYQRNTLLRR